MKDEATDSVCKKLQPRGRDRTTVPISSLLSMPVHNFDGTHIGVLKDLMIETDRGAVAYAVLLFEDDKRFALSFNSLRIDHENRVIYVDIQYEVFESGTGLTIQYKDHN